MSFVTFFFLRKSTIEWLKLPDHLHDILFKSNKYALKPMALGKEFEKKIDLMIPDNSFTKWKLCTHINDKHYKMYIWIFTPTF